jgi:hypothetical protein
LNYNFDFEIDIHLNGGSGGQDTRIYVHMDAVVPGARCANAFHVPLLRKDSFALTSRVLTGKRCAVPFNIR